MSNHGYNFRRLSRERMAIANVPDHNDMDQLDIEREETIRNNNEYNLRKKKEREKETKKEESERIARECERAFPLLKKARSKKIKSKKKKKTAKGGKKKNKKKQQKEKEKLPYTQNIKK